MLVVVFVACCPLFLAASASAKACHAPADVPSDDGQPSDEPCLLNTLQLPKNSEEFAYQAAKLFHTVEPSDLTPYRERHVDAHTHLGVNNGFLLRPIYIRTSALLI